MAAGGLALGGWALLDGLRFATFPPLAAADWFIGVAPGRLATTAIEELGRYAQPLLVLAATLLTLVSFALLGGAAAALTLSWAVRLAFVPLVIPLVALTGAEHPLELALLLAVLLAAALFYVQRLERVLAATPAMNEPTDNWLEWAGTLSRREALTRTLALGSFALVGGLVGSWGLRKARIRQPETLAGLDLARVRERLEVDALASNVAHSLVTPDALPPVVDTFDAPEGVHDRYTSNGSFYVVDIAVRDPRIVERDWTLRVHGAAEREVWLTYSDLLSLPAVELDGTLLCISFEYANSLISTTRWTGVLLRDILALAGPLESTVDVALHGAGGYSDSIPLAKALEPTTLAAYGMNGQSLAHAHGFPCRVFVPNLYGIKNVKWLQEIELVPHDFRGFWQERAWTDIAEVNTICMIDTPWEETPLDDAGMVWVGGIAFAGSRGVSRVELSVDDGPWWDCECEPYEPELVWQRWRYAWPAQPGSHRLAVRAFDLSGVPQIAEPRPPHPDGLTGLDRIEVRIL